MASKGVALLGSLILFYTLRVIIVHVLLPTDQEAALSAPFPIPCLPARCQAPPW